MQTTNSVLMVRPAAFHANPQTRGSNAFQKSEQDTPAAAMLAQRAFDDYVSALRAAGVDVHIMKARPEHDTPDAVFPNNWFALLEDGSLFTFPMEAPNRRRERQQAILDWLASQFEIRNLRDLSAFEQQGRYLEGTGSLILDHDNHLAYACRSSRSAPDVGEAFERQSGYRIIWFDACDSHKRPIYHTNVMMSLGARFAVVCLAALPDDHQRQALIHSLTVTGKTLIDVSFEQMEAFACNILELHDACGKPVYAMSTRAWRAFTPHQQRLISDYARLALGPIDIIEDLGGGGARCMLAELFAPRRPGL